ncbi:histidinol-phosphatase HisJ family protein [bacterium 1xD42-87]|nr:histidinol-phosphatase HisJ family protein [bacterium 1xD42-87]
MFVDYHVHTDYSDDSDYPMEDVVKDAIRLGMDEICFTDHVDYGAKVDWDSGEEIPYCNGHAMVNVDYPAYVEEIRSLGERYGRRLAIKMGLEFGMQKHTIPQFEALYRRYPFDFIILSVHQIEDKGFWSQEFQQGRTQKEYNERYYEELLYLVRHYQNYSVLGHLDLVLRYDKQGIYPFHYVKHYVEEILAEVIKNGKGVEINTSSHRYGVADSTPSKKILTMYHEMGGEILTLGSDSHAPAHLGTYMEESKKLLKEIGFRSFCTYEKMQPVFHEL